MKAFVENALRPAHTGMSRGPERAAVLAGPEQTADKRIPYAGRGHGCIAGPGPLSSAAHARKPDMTDSQAKRDARRERLRAAHKAFEHRQWQGQSGQARLARGIDHVWAWADRVTLAELVSQATLTEAVRRAALTRNLPAELAAMIGAIAEDVLRDPVHRDTRVGDVLDPVRFDDGVALFVSLETLRARLFEYLLDSPVYSALASDLLYQGIKDYIFSDSGAIQSIPGVSRLIRGSSSAVARRMPGLEAQVEKRVRSYIQNNTSRVLARSRSYLLASLDGARIHALADELWADTADRPLAVAELLSPAELQRLVDYGLALWRDLRESEYVDALVERSVQSFYIHYGEHTLTTLLTLIGLDRATLDAEAAALGPELLAALADTGLLDTLIADQLDEFYDSAAFAEALSDSPAADDD